MNLKRVGERGFIEEIRRRFGDLAPPSPAGIGDDAALLLPARAGWLASTDCLIETRHFRRDEPAHLLGRKSLAVNLSDMAAVGGRPESFLLTLAVPSDLPPRFLDDLLEGLASSARQHAVKLVGGDTSGSPGPLVISITILGRAGSGRGRAVLTRAGARPGDGIYLSGPIGGSAAGRVLIERGWRPRFDTRGGAIAGAIPPPGASASVAGTRRRIATRAAEAMRSHLDPSPRISLGRRLLEERIASAAIDVSDGLSTDLFRLAQASRAGARILAPALPIADSARALAPVTGSEPLELALNGGEDYELLFTVPPPKERRLAGLDAVFIGRITSRAGGLTLADSRGSHRRLRPGGWDHLTR